MSHYQYGAQVHANGIRQHYLRYGGRGPALVIVPGITSPAVTWGFVAERFGARFDTYVQDVRGRGLSQAGDDLDYGLDAQADDVAGLIRALGLNDVTVLGHSMGGRIAIRMARRHPDLPLARLILADPPVSGPGRRPYPASLPWYVDSIRAAVHGMDADAMREFCPTWTEQQLRLRAQWLHTCDERAVVQSFEDFQRDDIHQDLPRVTVPTLLMGAGRGDVVTDADAGEVLSLLPDARFTRVENAGHMLPWDDEEGFYRACGDFLGCPI